MSESEHEILNLKWKSWIQYWIERLAKVRN